MVGAVTSPSVTANFDRQSHLSTIRKLVADGEVNDPPATVAG